VNHIRKLTEDVTNEEWMEEELEDGDEESMDTTVHKKKQRFYANQVEQL